jgi:hypothetical protein
MGRQVSNHCVGCGFGFLYGPIFTDFLAIAREHGFRRTYGLDYRFCAKMFGHQEDSWWPEGVTLADCDSMFLGCVVDPDMRCPKCGAYAFPERSE